MKAYQVDNLTFQIDFSQPLYEQVLMQMRSLIAKGAIGLGEKIPSVRDMAHDLKINPNTVMHAYQELERDGLIEKRRGQGTFVTQSGSRIQQFRNHFAADYTQNYLDKMHALGFNLREINDYIKTQQSGGLSQ
ncbi:GntR family transcriptional regulator [Sporolactobacillus spathodeae]|uniref:GntR family transcriptional regulator n=1 Tax=Sporolactobacillus spathodeae TaxID=1465502 RepID=A0ABS2QA47_9BACL|nr:GntR family transcriptional regulator [Sporolactobacillus spathodeae]MBM7658531.1 GntR family transcriptional regulator [Sporolactobacillus spathodeae]